MVTPAPIALGPVPGRAPQPDFPITVLVADADVEVRTRVAAWLAEAGYRVVRCDSPEACAGHLAEAMPAAVLMGWSPTTGAPSEVLRSVRAHQRYLPVIALVESHVVDEVTRAESNHLYEAVPRTVSRERLVKVVANAVESHRMAVRLAALERELRGGGFPGVVGSSPAMRTLYGQIERLAAADISVALRGEPGTGKALIARAIHDDSGRRAEPFVSVDCASIPRERQAAAFFGHPSSGGQCGGLAHVDGGTLYLRAISALERDVQTGLLHVLTERRLPPVPGRRDIRVNFRLLTAHREDPRDAVQRGRLLEDLYFRLTVYELDVPPLRARSGDVPLLVDHFVHLVQRRRQNGGLGSGITPAAMALLLRHNWPGNVRELEEVIAQAVVRSVGEAIGPDHLPAALRAPKPDLQRIADRPMLTPVVDAAGNRLQPVIDEQMTMADVERLAIELAMERNQCNRAVVAQQLGIGRTTLYRKLKSYGWP